MQPVNQPLEVALAFGGNLGDPEVAFRSAIDELKRSLRILRVAPLFRSSPISSIRQPDFLNTALLAETLLDPWQLLGLAKALEIQGGRVKTARFGPRHLDIDLLLCGDLRIDEPELQLPHPRLRERRFFLAPLAEIAAEMQVPPGGETVAELLAALGNEQQIAKVAWEHGVPT